MTVSDIRVTVRVAVCVWVVLLVTVSVIPPVALVAAGATTVAGGPPESVTLARKPRAPPTVVSLKVLERGAPSGATVVSVTVVRVEAVTRRNSTSGAVKARNGPPLATTRSAETKAPTGVRASRSLRSATRSSSVALSRVRAGVSVMEPLRTMRGKTFCTRNENVASTCVVIWLGESTVELVWDAPPFGAGAEVPTSCAGAIGVGATAGRSRKAYWPFASLDVTGSPGSSRPFALRSTNRVTPSSGASPGSLTPLRFTSSNGSP